MVNVYSISWFRYNHSTSTQTGRTRCVSRTSGLEWEKSMSPQWNRRDVLKGLAAASTALTASLRKGLAEESTPASAQPVEIQITPISPHTFRLSILAVKNGSVGAIPSNGSLVRESWGTPHRQAADGAVARDRRGQSPAQDWVQSCEHGGCRRGWQCHPAIRVGREDRRFFFPDWAFTIIWPGRGRPPVRSAWLGRPHAQRTRRLPASHPRRPGPHSLGHRNIGMGHIFSPTLRHV